MTMQNAASPAPRFVVANPDTPSRPALSRRGSSASTASARSASSTASERVAAWAQSASSHAVAPDSVAVNKFSTDVAALMKRTQVARNVLPMIVRGGTIAAVGMLLFGHFAPIAILGTMVGALVGGYLIAKFMQLRLSKQMQSGSDAQLMESIRHAPEGASPADIAKQQELLSFIEGGNVFKTGVLKAYGQPFKAASKSLNAAADNVQARVLGNVPNKVRPGSPTLTETDDETESGSVAGDDAKPATVIEMKERPPTEEGRFTREQKGKGRADGKVFINHKPVLVPSDAGINDAALWAAPTQSEEAAVKPLIDLRSGPPSSVTLASLSTRGEEKVGLLSDDEAQEMKSPVLQSGPGKIASAQLSRSPSIKSMQATVSDIEDDGGADKAETNK